MECPQNKLAPVITYNSYNLIPSLASFLSVLKLIRQKYAACHLSKKLEHTLSCPDLLLQCTYCYTALAPETLSVNVIYKSPLAV